MRKPEAALAYTVCALALLFTFSAAGYGQKVDVYSWPKQVERRRNYDALHYRIKLRFDEAGKTFWGENTITLMPLENNFTTCVVDAEILRVTSVVSDRLQPLQFEQQDGSVIIHLGRPYTRREKVSFTIKYYSKDPRPDPRKYGMSPDYSLGLDFKQATKDNPQLISTLSFPEGARHWFPCNDQPNDKVTSDIFISIRSDYNALSNGRLVGVEEDAQKGIKTFHWSQAQPHSTYLFVVVAGPYVVIKDRLGSLPINYWVYKKDESQAMRSFSKTPEIIAFFNQEFGFKYPWAKYDQATIPGIGGGAESTTATVVGQSIIHDQQAEQDFSSAWLVAHEAAHQWWGDLITMRTWSETWLNESFATYGEYLYSRHALGEDEGAINLLAKKNAYLQEAHTRYQRPIVFDRYRFPNDNFDRHTYQKGAVVLQMLRFVLGDKAFLRSISRFLHQHAFQAVDTRDLMKTIKETTGQNLDWFFDQWVYKPGHPEFDVSYTWDKKAGKLRLRVIQKQDTSQGTPIFKMPVVVAIASEGGKLSKTVWLRDKEQEFEFNVTGRPLMVKFDEGNYLLKEWTFTKSLDELLYQLSNDDVIGRMWAATELSRFKDDPKAIAALIESARRDPFWAVRARAVESLGGLQRADQIELLKEKATDSNSKVRAAALTALGNYKQKELIGFFEERFEKDDSYIARAEALRAIGKAGVKSSAPMLEKAARLDSPRDIIKTAAEWALQQILSETK